MLDCGLKGTKQPTSAPTLPPPKTCDETDFRQVETMIFEDKEYKNPISRRKDFWQDANWNQVDCHANDSSILFYSPYARLFTVCQAAQFDVEKSTMILDDCSRRLSIFGRSNVDGAIKNGVTKSEQSKCFIFSFCKTYSNKFKIIQYFCNLICN